MEMENKRLEEEMEEELPPGWTVEVKEQKDGSKYKCYIAPLNGLKFYSKRAVDCYLKTGKPNGCRSKLKKRRVKELFATDAVRTVNTVEGLPPGWTKEIRFHTRDDGSTRKDSYYIDPVEGYIFRSRSAVFHYLDTGEVGNRKKKKNGITDVVPVHQKNSVVRTMCTVEGFPPGWIKEDRIKMREDGSSRRDSYYIDPVGGSLFRSKREAFCYLDTGEVAKRPRNRKNINDVKSLSAVQIVDTVEGLPPGWTQEIRVRKGDGRKDVYYIDPVERYVFRSRKEVFRYLDNGEVGSRARRKSAITDVMSVHREIPKLTALQKQKGAGSTRRCLFSCKSSKSKTRKSDQIMEASIEEEKQSPSVLAFDQCRNGVDCADNNRLALTPSPPFETKDVDLVQRSLIRVDDTYATKYKNTRVGTPIRVSRRLAGLEPEITPEEHTRKLKSKETDDGEKPESCQKADDGEKPESCQKADDGEKPESCQKAGSLIPLIFGDGWVDPCLEFAFKTLTGAIPLPVEDNVAVEVTSSNRLQFCPRKKTYGFEEFLDVGGGRFC